MISDAVKLSTVERLIATRRPFPRALRERFERDTREGSGPSSNRRSSFTIFYSRRTCFRPGRMAGLSGDSRGDRDAAHGRRRSRHSAAQIAHGPRDRCRDPAARDEPAGSVRFRREPPVRSAIIINIWSCSTCCSSARACVRDSRSSWSFPRLSSSCISPPCSSSPICAGRQRASLRWCFSSSSTPRRWQPQRTAARAPLYFFRLRESLRYAEADLSSRHDKLTSFFNRGGLDKALQELWQGPFTQVAAIMIDIDHFKSYNDHYGHLAGDSCLKEMAALIAA